MIAEVFMTGHFNIVILSKLQNHTPHIENSSLFLLNSTNLN